MKNIVIIILVGILIYAGCFVNPFIWDDYSLIVENSAVKSFSNIPEIFSNHLYYNKGRETNYYRPLQLLSYMVDYKIWRLKPFGYHLTSVLIHIINGILVYILCCRIQDAGYRFQPEADQPQAEKPLKPKSKNKPATCILQLAGAYYNTSLIISLLWLVHPIHTQAVTYVSGRADLLATMFILLALLQVTSFKPQVTSKIISQLMVCGLFICALLSKESAIIFPFLLLLIIWIKNECHSEPKAKQSQNLIQRLPRSLWLLAMTSVIAFTYIVLRLTILNFSSKSIFLNQQGLYLRLLTFFKAIVVYISMLIAPLNLHMQRTLETAVTIFDIKIIASIVVVVLILTMLKTAYKKDKIIFCGGSWFLTALLPVSNIFLLGTALAEHWLYLPSIGFFMILGYAVFDKLNKNKNYRLLALILYCLIFTALMGLTVKRNIEWKNPASFYKKTIGLSEMDNFKTYLNLGTIYETKGDLDSALSEYKKSLQINGKNALIYNNIGNVYQKKGMFKQAIKNFKKAIEIDPKYVKSYNNLGIVYAKQNRLEKAIEIWEQSLSIKDNYASVYNNLARLYEIQGKYSKAIENYEKAVKYNPDIYTVWNNLGILYSRMGLYDDAKKAFKQCLLINKHCIDAYYNLGTTYELSGQNNKALTIYNNALKINPNSLQILNSIGVFYAKQGNLNKAKTYWQKALTIDPDFKQARENVNKLKYLKN